MGISTEEHAHITLLRQHAEEAMRGKPVDVGDLSIEDVQDCPVKFAW